jgi:GMP synthase (glutamine-hydrolysing)
MNNILILDFGSQYTQLIARKIRECNIYCEIIPFRESIENIKAHKPQGIILSGGPASIHSKDAFKINDDIFNLNIPILGICYGMQLIADKFDAKVISAKEHEYGEANLCFNDDCDLFHNIKNNNIVWMSHADRLESLPSGFRAIGHSDNSPFCAIANDDKKIYAIQFHPEVSHSIYGAKILENFAINICKIEANWTSESFIDREIKKIKEKVGNKKVICALSGGVDSSVVAVLLNKAINKQLICVFVDNGLLRKNEVKQVEKTFSNLNINLITVNAKDIFLEKLKGISDPEQKRKIIGHTFIDIFDKEANKHKDISFLAQGTLYPDVIESVSLKGPSKTIKSHHNVGGLPENMKLDLIEPLRELFKDEVRKIGLELDMPKEIINRQPFPGPGLAIRIMGSVTENGLYLLQEADFIVLEEIKKYNLYNKIWQSFAVLLNVNSVGVMGDNRTYENCICVRIVESTDGMTANFSRIDYDVLNSISKRIINEVSGINRVVYDISSKPPATIEWE